MKINEIDNVVRHPAFKRKETFDNLLMSDDQDDIIAFIMDDNNPQGRRLALLNRLDSMLGQEKDAYFPNDLDDFMHDSGEISPEESEEIARDLKLPPYHLSVVDEETQDDDISTGEYELCNKCFGEGCSECEEGLVDVTGEFKIPNFSGFK